MKHEGNIKFPVKFDSGIVSTERYFLVKYDVAKRHLNNLEIVALPLQKDFNCYDRKMSVIF